MFAKEQARLDSVYDKFLDAIGGLGRFQWAIIFIFFMCIDGISFMLYNMSYLELIPQKFYCNYPGET